MAELGTKIQDALQKMNKALAIDDKLLQEVLQDIAMALLNADVNIKFVAKMRENVKAHVALHGEGGGANMRKLITQSVVEELTKMLESENKPYEFQKGKPNVVMFVGLQGAGKTTTCTKFAYHYMRKGWRVGLVCADTFRAGAFD